MTERGREALARTANALMIGPSALRWDRGALTIDVDETCAPLPRALRGRIVLEAKALNTQVFPLAAEGGHFWRPIAPLARVRVEMDAPGLSWSGAGYFDANLGAEPLEDAFSGWSWSRARAKDGALVLYDASRRREGPLSLALRFGENGGYETFETPPAARLSPTRWRLARATRADDARAHIVETFEDTPFYSRALVAHRLGGQDVRSVFESLSLDRFANPLVKAMLPFRMPRW